MKSRDLRLGNLLYYDLTTDVCAVYYIGEETFDCKTELGKMNQGIYNPIPITQEWLLKFGFEKTDNDEYTTPFDRKRLIIRFNDNGEDQINTYWIEDIGMADVRLTFDIQFIHELQNLWFSLKGKELIIL